MATFGTILKQLRQRDQMTQSDLAARLKVSRSTIGMYETGGREPDFETLEAIADLFNVDMNYLHGKSGSENKDFYEARNIIPLPSSVKIPLLGTVACGEPILAEENLEGLITVPDHVHADFALRCKGDSMIGARIMDGDIVCVRSQPDVEDGEIGVVLVEDEATLKRVYKIPGRIILRPENPAYTPLEYADSELDQIRILGKAVFFISQVR